MGFWMVAVTGGFCRLGRRRVGQEWRRRWLCRKKKRTNRLILILSPKSPPFFFLFYPTRRKKRLAVLRFWDSLCNSERARVQRQGENRGERRTRGRGERGLQRRAFCARTTAAACEGARERREERCASCPNAKTERKVRGNARFPRGRLLLTPKVAGEEGFSKDALSARGGAGKGARRETRPRKHPGTRREAAVGFGVGCSPHRAG